MTVKSRPSCLRTMLCSSNKKNLARQDLSWRSVPADGRQVILKCAVNDNMADENVSVVSQVSECIIAAVRRAAELIGVRLACMDTITPDARLALEGAGGTNLEVNTTPGFQCHYFRQDGASHECPF
jgi:D-alanine-D-alanine ligase-like ATP-grasp enzyme